MTKGAANARTGVARVLIVDDHPIVREGLAVRIAGQPDLEVCGAAGDVPGALALVDAVRPDVAVVDISLKDGSGIDLIKRIKARSAPVAVVVWSMHPEGLYAERALRAGALGYVNKARDTEEILRAIRTVLAGKLHLSDELSEQLVSRLVGRGERDANGSPVETLSDRELEAFELIGRGLATEEIARSMHVSPKTVETYRARIKQKLGLHRAAELVQHATQWVLEQA
jgi:DNA-binding NarL/FixJ family response regulator